MRAPGGEALGTPLGAGRVSPSRRGGPTLIGAPNEDGLRWLTRAVVGMGLARLAAGVIAWCTVRAQLRAERIVIQSGPLAGRAVQGPVTAFAQTVEVRATALSNTDGRTFAEIDQSDPLKRMALHATLIRSSLFSSMLAFGTAAAEMAHGLGFVVVGAALSRIARRSGRACG